MTATLIASLVALAFTVADWLQTRYISTHPNEWSELNPIIGEHPAPGSVNSYFSIIMVIVGIIGFALPAPWGCYGFALVAMFEAIVVARNAYKGVKFK